MENQLINIEIAYAKPALQKLLQLSCPFGTTVLGAITCSGLLAECPEIDLSHQSVGIFGKLCSMDQAVAAGDRIEIYRTLQCDPKQARRNRAKKK